MTIKPGDEVVHDVAQALHKADCLDAHKLARAALLSPPIQELVEALSQIVAKLQHPTASVTYLDQERGEKALSRFQSKQDQESGNG